MAICIIFRYIILPLLFLCALNIKSFKKEPPFSFSFEKFDKDGNFGSQIALCGDVEIRNLTVVMFHRWLMMCHEPVRFFGTNPGFSANFEFLISKDCGESLGFLMVPRNVSLIPTDGFLAVKFGRYRVVIDAGGDVSVAKLGYNGWENLHCWVNYDGVSKIIEVRVGKSRESRPPISIVLLLIDMSNALWREAMYVDISFSIVNSSQTTSDCSH